MAASSATVSARVRSRPLTSSADTSRASALVIVSAVTVPAWKIAMGSTATVNASHWMRWARNA
ncbi:Uncharacterised protein [Mycobacteroides abscessus subsp. abscessus]|nr:Uncharacterised protein [Mycobacteroides abscessus subsp. abscessus]